MVITVNGFFCLRSSCKVDKLANFGPINPKRLLWMWRLGTVRVYLFGGAGSEKTEAETNRPHTLESNLLSFSFQLHLLSENRAVSGSLLSSSDDFIRINLRSFEDISQTFPSSFGRTSFPQVLRAMLGYKYCVGLKAAGSRCLAVYKPSESTRLKCIQAFWVNKT